MFRHLFLIIGALFRLLCTFSKALWCFRYGLDRILVLPERARLSQIETRRLRHYFLGTQYLSGLFCSLLGRVKTTQEHKLFFDLSALASFFDDLVDAQRAIFESPNSSAPENPTTFGQMADERKLALHFFQNITHRLPMENLPMFQNYLQRVYAVEIAGQQWTKDAEICSIKKITAEKGGCAVLLFRCLMQPLPGIQETKAWMEFGNLIQLSDDIFDLWFDQQGNVATLATLLAERGRVGELEGLFEEQLTRAKRAFIETPVSKWRIRRTLAGVHVLTAITRTCLLRYQQLAGKHRKLPLNNRNLMVVDMEKWSNRWRSLRFLLFSR